MKALRIVYIFSLLIFSGISLSGQTVATYDSITARYRLRLNGKDLRSIVETISVASTHSQSPTAKAVYNYCNSILTSTTLTGDVTGTGTGTIATTIAANAIDSTKLAASSVQSSDIRDGQVWKVDLASNSVDSTKLEASSVQSSDIRDGQVWKVDLAANVIDSTKLAPSAVQSSDIADGAVWRVDLAANAVDSTKLAPSAVQSSDIADGAVWRVDLAANAVDSTKLAPSSVQSSDIADGAVWKVDLASNSVDSTKLEVSSVQSSDIRDGQVWYADLASNVVDSLKIKTGGIGMSDINQSGATAGQVLTYTAGGWMPRNATGGGGGGIDSTAANNGVSLSGKTVQLGNTVGGTSANFTADREIPTNSNKLIVSGVTKSVQFRGSSANNYLQISPDSSTIGGNNAVLQFKRPSSTSSSEYQFLSVDPPTKNTPQSPLLFSTSNNVQTGVSGNNVFAFGWNLTSGGAKIESGKPYIGEMWEQNYRPSAPTSYPRYIEKHEVYMPSYSNNQRRLSSYTITETATGANTISFYHTANVFDLRDTSGVPYFQIQGNANTTGAQLTLSGPGGNQIISYDASGTNGQMLYNNSKGSGTFILGGYGSFNLGTVGNMSTSNSNFSLQGSDGSIIQFYTGFHRWLTQNYGQPIRMNPGGRSSLESWASSSTNYGVNIGANAFGATNATRLLVSGQSTTSSDFCAQFYPNNLSNVLFSIRNDGRIGIAQNSPRVTFDINATDAIAIPSGTTGQRPTGAVGYIRHNTSTSAFEGVRTGTTFENFLMGSDAWLTSGNSVTAGTQFLGSTNNVSLRFRTNNLQRMIIDSTGRVGIGTNAPDSKVQIQGEGTTSSTYPLIVTNSTGTTSTAALAIRDDGKVGLGTNAPAEVLDVTGQARVDALDIRDWSTTDNTNTGEVHFETGSGTTYAYMTVGDGERRFPITPTNITLQAVDFDVAWTTGRTKAFWTVPAKYNGWKIYSVTLMVSTIGTGTNTIETEKGGVAQATTSITSASHVQVLDAALATDDIWTWDITAVSGTPTKGLFIEIILRHN